jgi:glutathione S-transferase
VVKAPTLVTDQGIVLMDSTLILDHAEQLVSPERRLIPAEPVSNARSQRVIGLALAACDKTVQIVYERNLRPTEKQHQPWIDRVQGQLDAAYRMLENEIASADFRGFEERPPLQAEITGAVAWRFTQSVLPSLIRQEGHPALSSLSARAERTEEFLAYPPT